MNWQRTGPKVVKRIINDDLRQMVVKFPWSDGAHYSLWHGDNHAGTFDSAEDAQRHADTLVTDKKEIQK